METGIPGFGGHGHRCRREILYLFQMEIQFAGDDSEFCHVFFRTSGMAAYKIRYDLLAQIEFPVQLVEDILELVELLERRLPHEIKHPVTGMFGSYFQASADMPCDEFARIGSGALVHFGVFALMQEQVIAYPASDETFLDARQCVYGMVDVKQRPVVRIQVRAYLGMNARRAFAAPA